MTSGRKLISLSSISLFKLLTAKNLIEPLGATILSISLNERLISLGAVTGMRRSGLQERTSLVGLNSVVFFVAHAANAVKSPLRESPASDFSFFLTK